MIALKQITVRFEEKTVLENFSLTLPETGVVCLSGPSGCGKTTLLRVLAGLQKPQGGTVTGVGKCAVVFQEDRLLPWLTAEKNLTVAAGISAGEAAQWLRRMELETEEKSLPQALSGGMRRRVAIARALAAESDVLLLDEPFQGLDEGVKELIYPLIRQASERKPVVLVTHHPQEAQALGARTLEFTGPPLHRKATEENASDD